jgi:hypothetical protein
MAFGPRTTSDRSGMDFGWFKNDFGLLENNGVWFANGIFS